MQTNAPIPIAAQNQDIEKSFIEAIKKGNLEEVKKIIEAGLIKSDAVLSTTGTPLLHAAACGHEHIVRYLVEEKGAKINFAISPQELTILMCAS